MIALANVILIMSLVICVICIGVLIASYVLNSLGLYRIAVKRGLNNPWLAWVPVAVNWIIGEIAEEYDKENGIQRGWSRILLSVGIITFIGAVIGVVCFVVATIIFQQRYAIIEPPVEAVFVWLMCAYGPALILSIVTVAFSICQMICMYKIFESIVPNKALKYWLIYLLVPMGGGICLLRGGKNILPKEY